MTYARIVMDFTLQTKSLLHIGSGETVFRRQLGEIEIDGIATGRRDGHDVPVIPGSGLRGVLRGLLDRFDRGAALGLFGSQDMGSRLSVLDAFSGAGQGGPHAEPWCWLEERRTGVLASTSVDAITGSAAEHLLKHVEVVHHGEKFDCRLVLEHGTDREIAQLMATLMALHAGEAQLGSNTADGWGRVGLHGAADDGIAGVRVRVSSPDRVLAWIASGAEEGWDTSLAALSAETRAAITSSALEIAEAIASTAARVSVPVVLTFDGPLMVAGAGSGGSDDVDAHTMQLANGQAVLPADSVRGVLRHHAAFILRTRLRTSQEALPPECQPLMLALFGSTRHQAALRISDFESTAAPTTERWYTQQFVSIDRFAGGAADNRLFAWTSAWEPTLMGQLSVDVDHYLRQYQRELELLSAHNTFDRDHAIQQAVGLLALMLRDLADARITFGAGASKGYGRCQATFAPVTTTTNAALSDPVTAAIRSPNSVASAALVAQAIATLPVEAKVMEPPGLPSDSSPPVDLRIPAPARVPGKFRNPFHFVPVGEPDENDGQTSAFDISLDAPGKTAHDRVRETILGHHRHAPKTISGTIRCRLTPETPTVIGAEQEEPHGNEPRVVHPARCPGATSTEQGRAIVPGSSVRGMVSAVHEAATHSALRVLDERVLTFRVRAERALPYIGQLIVENGKYFIRPLCNGPVSDRGQGRHPGAVDKALFPAPNFRVYLQGKIVHELRRATPASLRGDFGIKLPDIDSWGRILRGSDTTVAEELQLKIKQDRSASRTIGRKFVDSFSALRRWGDIPDAERGAYLRGTLLVMGREKGRELPPTKKHELFVPTPPRTEAAGWPKVPVGRHVVDQFHKLADLVRDEELEGFAQLPFEPIGQGRGDAPEPGGLRLKHGDLIWFSAALDGKTLRVTKVALSSIWRAAVGEDGSNALSNHTFFGGISSHLLPYAEGKQAVTASESLFGFATDRGGGGGQFEDSSSKRLTAYRSRVTFGFGNLTSPGDPFDPAITLRALMSPKPPSPPVYFTPVDQEARPLEAWDKERLTPSTERDMGSDPLGRKFYLHRSPANTPWKSLNPGKDTKFKARVTPLKAGSTVFTFNVHFSRLLPSELGMLLFALRPSEKFRHKLGMGKPLGLGTVRLDVEQLLVYDIHTRYGNAGWTATSRQDKTAEWEAARNSAAQALTDSYPNAVKALRLLGESTGLVDVQYPTTAQQGLNAEEDTYEWFVNNRKTKQTLAPLTEQSAELPRLDHN